MLRAARSREPDPRLTRIGRVALNFDGVAVETRRLRARTIERARTRRAYAVSWLSSETLSIVTTNRRVHGNTRDRDTSLFKNEKRESIPSSDAAPRRRSSSTINHQPSSIIIVVIRERETVVRRVFSRGKHLNLAGPRHKSISFRSRAASSLGRCTRAQSGRCTSTRTRAIAAS